MLVRGRGVVDIAEALHLSAKTVSTHKARLLKKLGLDNLSDLVRYALKHELT
jgi:DNA-binding NarL/FixJ family response regulator